MIFRVIWKTGKVPQQRKYAEGVWIPKEENARNLEQFRTISLLSVESKTFFKILSNCLMEFLLKNTYIDTSVQKGEVPEVPGCIEHTGVVTQLIWEAQESRGDLCSTVAGPRQRLWINSTQAGGIVPEQIPRPREDLQSHP